MQLRYVDPEEPGIARRRCGRGFVYIHPGGARVVSARTKQRLERLAVPPAWDGVWLCRDAAGHIQAMGFDARRRKQYIYHRRWRELQDRTKFDQLAAFGAALARMRASVEQALKAAEPGEAAVLAAAFRLLDRTGIRAGNPEYFRSNGTVGLTTLRRRHVAIDGARVELSFAAKGGRKTEIAVTDRQLARLLLRCEELPGQRLLRFRDEGDQVRDLDSTRLNEYLRELSGLPISAKDFRTWIATVTVIEAWLDEGKPLSPAAAARHAAAALCNTAAVARRSYIHPGILDIVGSRAPTRGEIRLGSSDAGGLRGVERLCRRLLGDS